MQIKKDAKPIVTDDSYYDLFEGGYIKPEDLLEKDDAKRVQEAVNVIAEFFKALEEAGLIEEF